MTIDAIGIAGTGALAAAVAVRIAAVSRARVIVHGFEVAKAGKRRFDRAANLFDLASECAAVIAVYDSHTDLRAALTGTADRPGLIGAMAPGSLLIDFSDGLPDECRRLAGQLAGGAIGLVECGYVGGVEALQCGEALIYAGGYGDHIDTVTPQLSALGRVTRIGPQGSGRMYAALSEAVRAAHFAALLEAQAVAHACGFVPDELAVPPLPAAEHARMAGHVTMARRIAQATGTPTPVFDALDEAAQATSIKRT